VNDVEFQEAINDFYYGATPVFKILLAQPASAYGAG
jgi:hypothetical protein